MIIMIVTPSIIIEIHRQSLMVKWMLVLHNWNVASSSENQPLNHSALTIRNNNHYN